MVISKQIFYAALATSLFVAAPLFAQEPPAALEKATPPPAAAEKPAAEKAPEKAPEKPADKPADKPAAEAKNADGIRVERGQGGQKLFRITEGLVVEGQRQKPNAFYVLQRASAPYDWEALDESFLSRILKAAERAPF